MTGDEMRELLEEALAANARLEVKQLRAIDALLPVVRKIAAERAADEIERIADERTWVTEHDNEVVSARDLYENIARLRGELAPTVYDFPPDAEATS